MSESVVPRVSLIRLIPRQVRRAVQCTRVAPICACWRMAMIREINREQQELRFDVQARGEPVANNASAKVESPYEIKIDESQRVLNSPASGGGYTFYVALVLGLLATTCGVAWFILYESALPFGVTSVSGLTGNRDLKPKAISSGIEQSSLNRAIVFRYTIPWFARSLGMCLRKHRKNRASPPPPQNPQALLHYLDLQAKIR